MKKILLAVLLAVTATALYAENLTVLNIGAFPRGTSNLIISAAGDGLIAALQDMNEYLNNVYIRPDMLEKWVNGQINQINSTNTNVTKVGKRVIPAKKIPNIALRSFTAYTFKSILPYVKVDNMITVSYAVTKTSVTVNLVLFDAAMKQLGRTSVFLDLGRMNDPDYAPTALREGLVTLYNMWNRYPYDAVKKGSVTLTLNPANTLVYVPSLNIMLKNGRTDNLPLGKYTVILKSSNYVSLVTNITVTEKMSYSRFNLVKSFVFPVQPGMPPVGHIYLDTDYPGATFVMVEDGINESLPKYITNVPAGEKNIIVQDKDQYFGTKIKVTVLPNDAVLETVRIQPKGSVIRVEAPIDGALISLDRRVAGVVSNGSFEITTTPGLHTLTVFKPYHTTYRTNINLKPGSREKVTVPMSVRNAPGLVITPQSTGAEIYLAARRLGLTPSVVYLPAGDFQTLDVAATNVGFNNVLTNLPWKWESENTLLANLTPLFGNLVLNISQTGSVVFINDIYMGTNAQNTLVFSNLPARSARVRVIRDGYRGVNTNLWVSPNVDTTYNFNLKEAPAKVFVGTSPEQGFNIYINGELAGTSTPGNNILSMEFGDIQVKLNKRGFKTIMTNISVSTRETVILLFTSMPGIGEEDLLLSAQGYMDESDRLVKNNNNADILSAVSNLNSMTNLLNMSEYKTLPAVLDILKKGEKTLQELMPRAALAELEIKVDSIRTEAAAMAERGDYTNSMERYKLALKIIGESGLTSDPVKIMSDTVKKDLEKTYKTSLDIAVKKVLTDAAALSDKKDYPGAIEKLRGGMDIVQKGLETYPGDAMIRGLKENLETELAKLAKYEVLFGAQKFQAEAKTYSDKKDYLTAMEKLREGVKLIETSAYATDPELISLKDNMSSQARQYEKFGLEEGVKKLQSEADKELASTNADPSKALDYLRTAYNAIVKSPSANEPATLAMKDQVKNRLAELFITTRIEPLEKAGDDYKIASDFENSIAQYDAALNAIDGLIEVKDDSRVIEKRAVIVTKRDESVKKRDERELTLEARKLIEIVNPIVAEADKLAETRRYGEAVKKYDEAINKIKSSTYSDNKKVQEHLARIEKRKTAATEDQQKYETWWPLMERSWAGISFDLTASLISTDPSAAHSFNMTNPAMNMPAALKLNIHIGPIVDVMLGGVLNFNLPVTAVPAVSNSVDYYLGKASPSAGFLFGLGLRIPIWTFVSLFANGSLILDFANAGNIMRNLAATAGMDLKFGMFGLKLYYEWGFVDPFKAESAKVYQGMGAGLCLWLTGE